MQRWHEGSLGPACSTDFRPGGGHSALYSSASQRWRGPRSRARAGTTPSFTLLHLETPWWRPSRLKGTARTSRSRSRDVAHRYVLVERLLSPPSIPASSIALSWRRSSPTPERPGSFTGHDQHFYAQMRDPRPLPSSRLDLYSPDVRARHGDSCSRHAAPALRAAPRCTVTGRGLSPSHRSHDECDDDDRVVAARRSVHERSSNSTSRGPSSRRWTRTRGCTRSVPSPCSISSRTTRRQRSR